VLIAILGVPTKCPPAPYEAALLLPPEGEGRGRRAAVRHPFLTARSDDVTVYYDGRAVGTAYPRPSQTMRQSPSRQIGDLGREPSIRSI
jgi:hypothetical protein